MRSVFGVQVPPVRARPRWAHRIVPYHAGTRQAPNAPGPGLAPSRVLGVPGRLFSTCCIALRHLVRQPLRRSPQLDQCPESALKLSLTAVSVVADLDALPPLKVDPLAGCNVPRAGTRPGCLRRTDSAHCEQSWTGDGWAPPLQKRSPLSELKLTPFPQRLGADHDQTLLNPRASDVGSIEVKDELDVRGDRRGIACGALDDDVRTLASLESLHRVNHACQVGQFPAQKHALRPIGGDHRDGGGILLARLQNLPDDPRFNRIALARHALVMDKEEETTATADLGEAVVRRRRSKLRLRLASLKVDVVRLVDRRN